MTPLLLLIPGLIAGIGIAVVVAAVLPRQPHAAAALERLGTTRTPETTTVSGPSAQIGSWVHRHLPDLPGFTVPTKDLALVGTSINRFYFHKALAGAIGLVAGPLFGLYFNLLGMPFFLPALAGIPLAVVGWFIPDWELRANAEESRREFARAVAVYLELVAAERHRGAPATQALESAASVGKSWVFVRIRQELSRAHYAGVQAWDALHDFSKEIGVEELSDVAKIVRISGEQGGSIYESLRSRGKGLRLQLLGDELTEANKLSERMSIPMSMLTLVLIGIMITPMLLKLVSP